MAQGLDKLDISVNDTPGIAYVYHSMLQLVTSPRNAIYSLTSELQNLGQV